MWIPPADLFARAKCSRQARERLGQRRRPCYSICRERTPRSQRITAFLCDRCVLLRLLLGVFAEFACLAVTSVFLSLAPQLEFRRLSAGRRLSSRGWTTANGHSAVSGSSCRCWAAVRFGTWNCRRRASFSDGSNPNQTTMPVGRRSRAVATDTRDNSGCRKGCRWQASGSMASRRCRSCGNSRLPSRLGRQRRSSASRRRGRV